MSTFSKNNVSSLVQSSVSDCRLYLCARLHSHDYKCSTAQMKIPIPREEAHPLTLSLRAERRSWDNQQLWIASSVVKLDRRSFYRAKLRFYLHMLYNWKNRYMHVLVRYSNVVVSGVSWDWVLLCACMSSKLQPDCMRKLQNWSKIEQFSGGQAPRPSKWIGRQK